MKKKLLKHLVCPRCGSHFSLKEERSSGGEITSGQLRCQNGHRFPIASAVPRLLDKKFRDRRQEQTARSFGEKWTSFAEASFKPEVLSWLHDWITKQYGFKSKTDLKDFLSKRRFILDAGCGLGRDVGWYAELSPKSEVFGVEISKAIDVAQEKYGNLPNVHLIQGDLTKLPFREGHFDYIASSGVLHHTPDTEGSFRYLSKFLKKGGEFSAYIYKRKAPMREFLDDKIRERTTKMTPEECTKFAEIMTEVGRELSKADVTVEGEPLQRYIYWNVMKCYWNENLGYDYSTAVNFDWYHPEYAHRHTPEEIKKWVKKLGLKIVSLEVSRSGVSIRAKKS